MQASLLNVFVRLSQKALDKSRGYGSLSSSFSDTEDRQLSDLAFTAMLKEIDAFSAQFCAAQAPGEGLQVQTAS